MPITIDGSLADWTEADRLEDLVNGASGYQVYGQVVGNTFNIALHSAVAIGADSTFWLNTNSNTATGFQIFGTDGGAEFNINFDVGGVAHLYTGDAGATFVKDITYAISGDGLSVEFALDRADLGGPSVVSLGVLVDINNTVFLPNSYSKGEYLLLDPASREFDGLLTEWTAGQRLETAATTVPGFEIYGKYANDEFIFAVKSNVVIGPNTTFWFDTDQNSTTGAEPFPGAGTGAEFNINFGPNGLAHLYSGAAGETFVADIQYTIGPDGKTIEFALPKSIIGAGVTQVSMKADINDNANLPGDFNSGHYTVSSDPTPSGTDKTVTNMEDEPHAFRQQISASPTAMATCCQALRSPRCQAWVH